MLDIQTVGAEILNNTPRSFYVFTGSEYGIKCKYIDILAKYYGKYSTVSSVSEVLKFLNTRHLIPIQPQLYIVRYDDEFLKSLNVNTAKEIKDSNILGTIVCIYEGTKSEDKLDKYIPDYTVDISGVGYRFMIKYIHVDFPNLPDRLVEFCVRVSSNYGQAQNIARCMSHCNVNELFELNDAQLSYIFGVSNSDTEDIVKISIASKNFNRICSLTDSYSPDQIMYLMLSTLVELEKLYYNKYCTSSIREYIKYWTLEDIYNMFMQTYQKLSDSRTFSTSSNEDIVYLAALTQFKNIPSVEAVA